MTKPVEAITQAVSMVIEPNGTEVKTDESKEGNETIPCLYRRMGATR